MVKTETTTRWTRRPVRRRVAAMLAILPLCGAGGAAEPPEPSPARERIVVGDDWDYPPYSFLRQGVPGGFNADLMRRLARHAHLDVEFLYRPWTEIRQALEDGRIHAVGGMFYSRGRDEKVDFTVPHLIVLHAFFVRKDSKARRAADLRGQTILVQESDILHDWLIEEGWAGRLLAAQDPSELLRRLAAGEGDAAAMPLLQGHYYARALGLPSLRAIPAGLEPQKYCIAVREGDERLLSLFNEGLAALKSTGEYQALYERWFGVYEERAAWSWLKRFAWIPALAGLLFVGSLLWSWALRRTVRAQTRRLLTARADLERRGQLLSAVAEAGARLLATPDIEIVLPNVLEALGRATGAHRVFVCEELVNPGGEHPIQSLRWEWPRPEAQGARGPQDRPATSRLMVPISAGRDVWGVIGFEAGITPRPWAEADVDALRTAADAIGAALMRRRQESALRQGARREQQAAARWKALLDAMPALVWIAHDRAARRITGNRAANQLMRLHAGANASLTGPEDERPRNLRFLQEGRPMSAEELPLQRVAREGIELRGFEEEIEFADGARRTLLGNIVPLVGEDGQPDGAVAAFIDITELKSMEEEQRRLDRRIQQTQKLESLGVLAGGIAHDFNNLLMMILGNANLARGELPKGSPIAASLREIEQASRRAAELCRQMLAYSGKGRFVIERVNLTHLVEDISHMLAISVSKKASLQYEFARDLPFTEADATQLRQVTMNLILNASEAIGDGAGVIRVSTGVAECRREDLAECYLGEQASPGVFVCLEVSDSGCGMDPETLARIFEPFFTTKFTGRGLGLAAVLGIVRAHRGAIQVTSAPGRGTRFRVLLPAAGQPGEGDAAPPPDAHAASAWRGSGWILLADDEEGIRLVGRRMLEQLGFDVVTAEDGARALELFRERPDRWACVLLDLTMPKLDGMEVLQSIRAVRPDIRVVLASGYDEMDLEGRQARAGANAYVQKPYELSTLRARLREVLGA